MSGTAQETMYRIELTEEELLLVMAVVEDYSAGYAARAVLEKCYACQERPVGSEGRT